MELADALILLGAAVSPGLLALAGVWYSAQRSGLAQAVTAQTEELRRLQEDNQQKDQRIEHLENELSECKADMADQLRAVTNRFEAQVADLYQRIGKLSTGT